MVKKLSHLTFNVVISKDNPNKVSIQNFSSLHKNINLTIQTNEIGSIMAYSDVDQDLVGLLFGKCAVWVYHHSLYHLRIIN